ncbi:hypothetical protein [Streptomyces sp. NPDC059278]|uniref:hypothetical protein n=1 Tax=Streptomyces sp. NPDC059278 TaxID=3346801 RepID=UPI00369E09CD
MTSKLSRRTALTVGAGGLLAALGSTAAMAVPSTETALRRGRGEGDAAGATYRILNGNWSLKGYPDPNQPGTGTVVCDSRSAGDSEEWITDFNGDVATIKHSSTGLYAYAEGNDVRLTNGDGLPPSRLSWRLINVGPSAYDYAIWVPGQFTAWTLVDKDIQLEEWERGLVEQGFTIVPA